ncbi:hypothetical protein ES703_122089 [subsurface metagenome]
MNEHIDYLDYLNSIDINTETLFNKIDATFRAAVRISQEEIQDIFISDWIQTEGRRAYEHLYLFTNTYIIESAHFTTDTNVNIEMTILKERVKYVMVKYNDYFEKANTASRLSVFFITNGGAFKLTGAKENCDKLIEVYDKYVRPNISKVPIPE